MISVVVPAYNVEKYVTKCINSLATQSFHDTEIILVDDGSTDSTSSICDELASQYNQVFTYHKENGGLSDARNYGISKANGEFITFVDSDDYVSHLYLEELMDMMTDDVQITMVNIQHVYEDKQPSNNATNKIEKITAKDAISRMLLRQGYTHCGVGKLYRKQLWKELRFPVGRLYEDYLTTYRAFSEAKAVKAKDNKSYYYLQREGSIMHYDVSPRTLSLLEASDEVTDFVIGKYPELRIPAIDLQMASYLKTLQNVLNYDRHSYTDVQNRIIKFVSQHAWELICSKQTPNNDKVKIASLLLGKKSFLTIYNKFGG